MVVEGAVLKVENLTVNYNSGSDTMNALDSISFTLERGGSLGIMGESGSGKTTTGMAIMGLLDKKTMIDGSIYYRGIDLQNLTEDTLNQYRWRKIATVFQNSLDVLNPVLSVNEQIVECLKKHLHLSVEEGNKKIDKLLESVGLETFWKNYYPHQLSGGIRQRVLVAMALSCDPEILIVDEPTNGLDTVSKNEIIELLLHLQRENKFGMIVISHEMKTITRLTSRLVVMYQGCIVEEGVTHDIFNNPMHNYTRGLLNSSPDLNPYGDLWGIPGETTDVIREGCPFCERCNQHIDRCKTNKPSLEYVSIERKVACNRKGIVTLLQGSGLNKIYEFKGKSIKACDNCKIELRSGEILALVGQSGSGKTTLATILSGVLKADGGDIRFNGEKVRGNSAMCKKNGMQIVFQDPFSSINEHFTVEQAIREPLDILEEDSAKERQIAVIYGLQQVQLPCTDSFLSRKCYTLSGGQRQRVALARALVMKPRILIADEISSMLDASTQANILRLLKGLQNLHGFAMLYITHDLTIAQKIADKVYVMQKGRIIEKGTAYNIFNKPVESYTQKLVKEGRKSLF